MAYNVLEWAQLSLDVATIFAYTFLFCSFMLLIKRRQQRLRSLLNQVVTFFSVMLFTLILNWVLDLVFYLRFDPMNAKTDQEIYN